MAEDELMPFPVLDACLHSTPARRCRPTKSRRALVSLFPQATRAQAHDWATRFAQLFTQSIYKWVQSPLSLHVGSLDLDRERALQLPVVQKTEWTSAVLRPASSTKDAKVAKDAKATKAPEGREDLAVRRPQKRRRRRRRVEIARFDSSLRVQATRRCRDISD